MLLAAALWLAQGVEWAHSGLERELWVRALAAEAAPREAQCLAALGDDDWVARAAALDALRRARLVDRPVGQACLARALELARVEGASERAAALDALAGHPAALALEDSALDGAARGAPRVVLALVGVLEGLPRERALPRLAALTGHPDERVREAARAALAARGDGCRELALDLGRRDPRLEREAWMDGLERLERQPLEAPVEAALDELARALEGRADLDEAARAEGRAGLAALRAGRGLGFDAGALAGGLAAGGAGATRQHALVRRAAALQAPDGGELARALVAAARAALEREEDADAALDAALDAAPRLEWLAGLDGELAYAAWVRLGVRGERLPAAQAERWLDARVPLELRELVVEVAATLDEGAWLARALADPALEADAFRALATLAREADAPEAWTQALHRAWRAADPAERLARLRQLPRERALAPFRDDLLRLGDDEPAARAECAELLGVAGAPGEVRAALSRWLDAALDELRAAGGAAPEARAVALAALRGLALDPGTDAPAALERAARATAQLDPAVAKRALALLAGRDDGAPLLSAWLAPEQPTRLRTEAALGLAARGEERAGAVLAETYTLCDVVLRARALRALAPLSGAAARGLAREVLRAPGEGEELVRLAVEWFARHGPGELLLEALAEARDPERVDALLAALGERARGGEGVAREGLLAAFARAGERPPSDELEAARRESLMAALAAAGVSADELRADWLSRPLARAADDLRARFLGERLAGPTFLYRGELALAAALAARGELGAELAARGDALARLDARFAAHLGLAAGEREPAVALALLDRARVGLAGEDPGEDGPEVELGLRRARLDACEAQGRFDLAAAELGRLAADWRALRLDERAAAAWLGEPAPGRDPRARLESALWQARAWAALSAGEAEGAARLAREAARRVGRSADARAAQARLEQALR